MKPPHQSTLETTECWADLFGLTQLKRLRLARFPLAKAAASASFLQLEYLEVVTPLGGQTFDVS